MAAGPARLGAVVAVDLDVVVGQIAAPGGGRYVAAVQFHQNFDFLFQQDLLGFLLGEFHTGTVFADQELTGGAVTIFALVNGMTEKYVFTPI